MGEALTKEGSQLKRQLGLRTATAVVVGETIAVGIFLTPAGMAKSLGSPFWLLLVWLLTGAMALCGALCYGELAARLPEAGGGYVYLREAYGRPLAFLYGWMAFLVMDPGITAALAVGMAGYAGFILPLPPAGQKALAVGAILLMAAVNISGVRAVAGLLRWLTAAKLGLLLFVVAWGFASGAGDWSNFEPFVAQRPGSTPLVGALAGAFVGAFFSFGGWWDLSKLSGEVREPARNLPRALACGVMIVTLAYVLVSAVFVYLVPMGAVTSGETFAAQAGAAMFGAAGGRVFSAVVVVAVLGSLAGLTMAAPRVYYAMARDGLFFQQAARLHPRTGTPAAAIALQAALASLLVALGTFDEIVAYFVFIVVVFLALTVAAVYVLRRRQAAPPAFATPGYPLTPLFFLVLVALLLLLLGGNSPVQALLGTGVVALGLPVYFILFRGSNLSRDDTGG
ncbi:MAG TPA: amino acid permease [Pyrinomonadaceae bacterium]|nr:amino acid permease [Pyrinomonadaceae bacterium]